MYSQLQLSCLEEVSTATSSMAVWVVEGVGDYVGLSSKLIHCVLWPWESGLPREEDSTQSAQQNAWAVSTKPVHYTTCMDESLLCVYIHRLISLGYHYN